MKIFKFLLIIAFCIIFFYGNSFGQWVQESIGSTSSPISRSGNVGIGYFTLSNTTNSGHLFVYKKIGIGTSSPKEKLSIYGGNIEISPALNTANGVIGTIGFSPNDYSVIQCASINGVYEGTNWNSGSALTFSTNAGPDITSGSVSQERMRINKDGNVGIGTSNPYYKLQVNGGVSIGTNQPLNVYTNVLRVQGKSFFNERVAIFHDDPANNYMLFVQKRSSASTDFAIKTNGQILSDGVVLSSDRRYKKNIKKIENSIDIIKQLNGQYYEYNTEGFEYKKFDNKKHFGFIAQEVQMVVPEIVQITDSNFLGINYIELIPFITEAIKEQQIEIEGQIELILEQKKIINKQSQQLDELFDRVKTLEQVISKRDSAHSQNEKSYFGSDLPQLYQNSPNPFTNSTVIEYYLPSNCKTVSLNFYTISGKLDHSKECPSNIGKHQIEIISSDLKELVMFYSLIVDGKIVDSKKIIHN